ncbi:MAG: hypothetical protein ACJATA_001096 [Sphingobacteriales bacterium]|jgi:hypothetical protein
MGIFTAFLGFFNKDFRIFLSQYRTINKVNNYAIVPRGDRVFILGLLTVFHYLLIPFLLLFFLFGNQSLIAEFIPMPNIFVIVLLSLILIRRFSNDFIHLHTLIKNNKFSIFQHTFVGILIWFYFELKLTSFTS